MPVEYTEAFSLLPGEGMPLPSCLPPALDQAAQFAEDGSVKAAPKFVSVKHNGILIHDDQALPGATRAAGARGHTSVGPLMLQDHGNPLRYRNIWIVEK